MAVIYSNEEGSKVLYEGAVLATRERNYRDDSDFYAVVWDGERVRTEEYATTRYCTYGNTASVDITPENKAKADAWAYQALRKVLWSDYLNELKTPVKGDTVVVARGRKGVGSTGKLFWIGNERTYGGYSEWSQTKVRKVGVALNDEKDENGRYKNVVWTYLANLDVADIGKKVRYSAAKRKLMWLKRGGAMAYNAYYSALVYM